MLEAELFQSNGAVAELTSAVEVLEAQANAMSEEARSFSSLLLSRLELSNTRVCEP